MNETRRRPDGPKRKQKDDALILCQPRNKNFTIILSCAGNKKKGNSRNINIEAATCRWIRVYLSQSLFFLPFAGRKHTQHSICSEIVNTHSLTHSSIYLPTFPVPNPQSTIMYLSTCVSVYHFFRSWRSNNNNMSG